LNKKVTYSNEPQSNNIIKGWGNVIQLVLRQTDLVREKTKKNIELS